MFGSLYAKAGNQRTAYRGSLDGVVVQQRNRIWGEVLGVGTKPVKNVFIVKNAGDSSHQLLISAGLHCVILKERKSEAFFICFLFLFLWCEHNLFQTGHIQFIG